MLLKGAQLLLLAWISTNHHAAAVLTIATVSCYTDSVRIKATLHTHLHISFCCRAVLLTQWQLQLAR
jgi:hypothetical protein